MDLWASTAALPQEHSASKTRTLSTSAHSPDISHSPDIYFALTENLSLPYINPFDKFDMIRRPCAFFYFTISKFHQGTHLANKPCCQLLFPLENQYYHLAHNISTLFNKNFYARKYCPKINHVFTSDSTRRKKRKRNP
jgi:hypothetical protein